MGEKKTGTITHFFKKALVAAIEITDGTLKIGDTIHIKGATTDFQMTIDSMQIDRNPVNEASVGQSIGIKVPSPVRVGDDVFLPE